MNSTVTAPAYNLLVLLILVTCAAFLQSATPPVAWGHAKLPWLVAIVSYYGMLRPVWLAGVSAVLAGLLLDGLGAVPVGTSLIGMALILAFCLLFGRRQMSDSIVSCVLVTVGGSALMTVLHYASLRWKGILPPLETSLLLARVIAHGVAAIPIGAVGALAAKGLDRAALNTHSEKNADSFDWSGDRI